MNVGSLCHTPHLRAEDLGGRRFAFYFSESGRGCAGCRCERHQADCYQAAARPPLLPSAAPGAPTVRLLTDTAPFPLPLPVFPGRILNDTPADYVIIPLKEVPPTLSLSFLSPDIEEVPQILTEASPSFLSGRGGLTELAGPCYWDRKCGPREAQTLPGGHRTYQ